MEHPQAFLLKKMAGYSTNGLESLGHLHAKHINDIVVVMVEFAEATAIELAERLTKGECIRLSDGRTIHLEKPKRKKAKTV